MIMVQLGPSLMTVVRAFSCEQKGHRITSQSGRMVYIYVFHVHKWVLPGILVTCHRPRTCMICKFDQSKLFIGKCVNDWLSIWPCDNLEICSGRVYPAALWLLEATASWDLEKSNTWMDGPTEMQTLELPVGGTVDIRHCCRLAPL